MLIACLASHATAQRPRPMQRAAFALHRGFEQRLTRMRATGRANGQYPSSSSFPLYSVSSAAFQFRQSDLSWETTLTSAPSP